MADTNTGYGFLMDAAQAAGDKAMEIAGMGAQLLAAKTTQAIGGVLAAIGSIIPGAGEIIRDATESVTAAISRQPQETLRPSNSMAIAQSPMVAPSTPDMNSISAFEKGVVLSSAADVSNANLGGLTPTAIYTGKQRELGGTGIAQS